MRLMQVVRCRGNILSPFASCDFALPPHRRRRADCSVLPVFFNKLGTVASSHSQTHVVEWLSTRQGPFTPAHTTSKLPVLSLHHISSPAHSQLIVMFCSFELLNLAHRQPLPHSPFPLPLFLLSSQSYNHPHPTPPPLELHSGLHDNTLWSELLSPRAAQTVSIFTPS